MCLYFEMFLESPSEGLLVTTWSRYILATRLFCDLMLKIKPLEKKKGGGGYVLTPNLADSLCTVSWLFDLGIS